MTADEDAPDTAELIAARPALRVSATDGMLFEGVPLEQIAAEYGTPCWVYGAATLRARARRLMAALPRGASLHYAVKALDHLPILSILREEGLGADVVSLGEIEAALAAGFAPGQLVFSGVGKARNELARAVALGIGQINVESAEELDMLARIAASAALPVRVALRVNPDVDAETHAKISTGRAGDKFGIPIGHIPSLYAEAARLPGVDLKGLAVHIGSQVGSAAAYRDAYGKMAALVRTLRAQGLAVERIDCGGGLPVPYRNEPALLPEAWGGTMQAAFAGLNLSLSAEPGRWIAAPAGVLLARVIRTRRRFMARPMIVLDAAMNDLLRPALYDAWHGVVPLRAGDLRRGPECADIVGPVCESSDVLGVGRPIPALADDAPVAILDAGAYGAVMSSTYNARPLAPAVLIENGAARLIRPRGTTPA